MIGIIGLGNMGTPLLKGAVEVFGKENVSCYDKATAVGERLSQEYGVTLARNEHDLAERCDTILLAVKPQVYDIVINAIAGAVVDATSKKTIISIAPGISTDHLLKSFDNKANIVRLMPNTPAKVNEGMTAVCFGAGFNGNKDDIFRLLDTIGTYAELPESLMNAATVASGSSPAFVYMFIEAMADAVVKYGIPRPVAYKMVAQMVVGSAKMVLETGDHPGKLKDDVCSPGGTTICGVAALEENGFRNAVIKACDAVYEKGASMKK